MMLCAHGMMGLSSTSNEAGGDEAASPCAGTRHGLKSEAGVGKVPAPFNFQLNPY